MGDTSFIGSQAFNRLSTIHENVIPNTGSLTLDISLLKLVGVRKDVDLELKLSYMIGKSGRLGLPTNWTLCIPFVVPNKSLEINGSRYIIDPSWQDSSGYASGLKYENNHGVSFVTEGAATPLPYGNYGATYQYKYSDVEGNQYYFDGNGCLVMKADRYGNNIYYSYTTDGKYLASITDSYGQTTNFTYGLGQLTISRPDGKNTTIDFSNEGVSQVSDPLNHVTSFTSTQRGSFNVLTTISYPTGKTTNLYYTDISFLDGSTQTLSIPAVSQLDVLDKNNNPIVQYLYEYGTNSGGYTFTGFYGDYELTSEKDGLLDSNNTEYVYDTLVKTVDANGTTVATVNTFYNFAHVPVKEVAYIIEANGTQTGYIEHDSTYDISQDKHNQQPNYLLPKITEKATFDSTNSINTKNTKTTFSFDNYGNTISKQVFTYNSAASSYAHHISECTTYFTSSGMEVYSLAQSSEITDHVTDQIIKSENSLAENNLDVGSSIVQYKNHGDTKWNSWKVHSKTFGTQGRESSNTISWDKPDYKGVKTTTTSCKYSYDSASFTLTTTITNALGNKATHRLSTMHNKVLSEALPSGATTQYTYDAIGRILSKTSPAGEISKHAYKVYALDGENSASTKHPSGYEKISYLDELGREVKQCDNGNPLNKSAIRTVSKKQYNVFNKVVLHSDIFKNTTKHAYNSLKKPTQTIDINKNVTDIVYSHANNTVITKINDVDHKKVVHDNFGKVVSLERLPNTKNTDTSSQFIIETLSTYSGFGKRLTKVVNSLLGGTTTNHSIESYEYDADQHIVREKFTAPNGDIMTKSSALDLNHKLIQQIKTVDYAGGKSYKIEGDICSFNELGQHTKLTNQHKQSESYTYNADGHMVSKTLFDGSVITYSYTLDGKKNEETWVENKEPHFKKFTYDTDGRILSTTDKSGTVANEYSLDGVLTSITYPDGKTYTVTLDQYSRKVSEKDASGVTTDYSYTSTNQLSAVKTLQDTLTYDYNDDLANNVFIGAPKSVKVSNLYTETYIYDAHNRKAGTKKHNKSVAPGKQNFLTEKSQINSLDQIVQITVTSEASTSSELNHQRIYQYDNFKQLIRDTITCGKQTVSDTSFTYDGNANVLTKTVNGVLTSYSYNALDQLMSYTVGSGNTKRLSYDSNGNLVQDGGGNSYTYDIFGKLLSVSGDGTVNYSYYPNDLLATRGTDDSSVTMYYDHHQQVANTFKGDTPVQFLKVGAKRFAAYENGANGYYYGVNIRQDTIFGLSSSGEIKGSSSYQSYGESKDNTLSLNESNNYAWNQEYQDRASNLVYLRARYYDPLSMRFISRDTKRLFNRYAYCYGDPINNVDPTGHDAETDLVIGGAVVTGTIGVGLIYAAITYGSVATAAVGGGAVVTSIAGGALAAAGATLLGAGASTVATVGVAGTVATAALTYMYTSMTSSFGGMFGGATGVAISAYMASFFGASAGQTGAAVLGGGMLAAALGNTYGSAVGGSVASAATTASTVAVNAANTAASAVASSTEAAVSAATAAANAAATSSIAELASTMADGIAAIIAAMFL